MSRRLRTAALALAAAALAACANDPAAPAAAVTAAERPHLLLGPGESFRTITDSTDAFGNLIMVNEYAVGIYTTADGNGASVASATIRTVVPHTGDTSGSCITSTLQSTATTPGWSLTIKKPGGCDKEIVIEAANKSTGKRATFSYLYISGKTRIDQGLVR